MPVRRVMGDMIMKLDGDVLIINGAQTGAQGWGMANPPLSLASMQLSISAARFHVLANTSIPCMCHSTANLLPDGRILLAGSNTHQFYTVSGPFLTELCEWWPFHHPTWASSKPHTSPCRHFIALDHFTQSTLYSRT